jgi:hypothetical protein
MSSLTGQQIQNSYQGLLKLDDSTTGITSTYQEITDGLGNSTNSKISSLGIISPNIGNMNNLKPDYGGAGFAAGVGTANVATSQNKTLYYAFYDPGFYSYSAVSYNLGTLTSTSDVVTMAFYTMQQINGVGIAPKDLIQSGITLTSAGSTGVKTTALPSSLSFSGTGGGYYIAAFYISNSGVTPTVRYGANITQTFNQLGYQFGYYLTQAGTALQIGSRYSPAVTSSFVNLLNLPFQATYSTSDIVSNILTPINQPSWGFGLNTIF